MKTIVLSAGHGGSDPGAVGNGIRESDVNLAITLACRDYLNNNYSGHRLVLPRDKDVYVSLPARRNLAASVNADLYVSMHNNAASNSAGRGFETFTHSGPLFTATLNYQKILHEQVWRALAPYGTPNRGMKRANHWVTRNMSCPTVLMEYLFVTNPQDASLLKRPEILKMLGEATGEGIALALKLPRKTQDDNTRWIVFAGEYKSEGEARTEVYRLKGYGYRDATIITKKG